MIWLYLTLKMDRRQLQWHFVTLQLLGSTCQIGLLTPLTNIIGSWIKWRLNLKNMNMWTPMKLASNRILEVGVTLFLIARHRTLDCSQPSELCMCAVCFATLSNRTVVYSSAHILNTDSLFDSFQYSVWSAVDSALMQAEQIFSLDCPSEAISKHELFIFWYFFQSFHRHLLANL